MPDRHQAGRCAQFQALWGLVTCSLAVARSAQRAARYGRAMARFFFHVTNGSTFKDAEGENCSSLEAPRTHAAEIAGELGKDRGYEGRHNRNRTLTYERGGKSGSRSGDLDI